MAGLSVASRSMGRSTLHRPQKIAVPIRNTQDTAAQMHKATMTKFASTTA